MRLYNRHWIQRSSAWGRVEKLVVGLTPEPLVRIMARAG